MVWPRKHSPRPPAQAFTTEELNRTVHDRGVPPQASAHQDDRLAADVRRLADELRAFREYLLERDGRDTAELAKLKAEVARLKER
jgi:hypothetical protein